jgi:glycosyltransferase involved in cell wall biosynthesis
MNETETNEVIISFVIPTLNRPNPLEKALQSIFRQTKLPDEIIIVDQSDDSKTQNLIKKKLQISLKKGISLRYMWEEIKSINHARNLGLHAATGNIVLFLDDDMIVDEHYVSEILKVFRNNPSAIGVQGCLFPPPYWQGLSTKAILLNYLHRIFLLTHWERNKQRVLLSGDIAVAYPLTRTIKATIIYPCVSAFKREMLKETQLDENLKGYSWQEEYFTLKLSQSYPHSLFVTPFARVVHDRVLSPAGRPAGKQLAHIIAAYEVYNFVNCLGPSLKNWIALFWKLLGRIIIGALDLPQKELRTRLLYTLQSYSWALGNLGEVRNARFNHR